MKSLITAAVTRLKAWLKGWLPVNVEDYGASPSASAATNTAAINAAFAAGGRRIVFPGVGYKVNAKIAVRSRRGLAIECAPSDGSGGTDLATLEWEGGAEPVMEFGSENTAGSVMLNLALKNLSINGAGVATHCLAAGDPNNTTFNELIKYVNSENCTMRNARIGVMFSRGGGSGGGNDIAGHTHANLRITGCTDHGLVVDSGNAAAVQLIGGSIEGNGYAPTNDTVNPGGKGTNVLVKAGALRLSGSHTAGMGATKPATADIYLGQNSLEVDTHWSDTHGVCIMQESGARQTLQLKGLRHYEGSMNDTNTPTSLVLYAKSFLDGCYLFGDVRGESGQAGSITAVATEFHTINIATKRPTLGQATYKGPIVTEAANRGLLLLNQVGNFAQIFMGGANAGVSLSHKGAARPAILIKGINGGITGLRSILQILGGADTDSGCTLYNDASTGQCDILVNCVMAAGGTAVTPLKTDKPCMRLTIGATTSAVAVRVADPNGSSADIPLEDFAEGPGFLLGGGNGHRSEIVLKLPERSSDPTFMSGSYWRSGLFTRTDLGKIRFHNGTEWKSVQLEA